MGDIQHELKVRASRPKVIEALTTLAALERWNRARVSGGPQEWTVAYPDGRRPSDSGSAGGLRRPAPRGGLALLPRITGLGASPSESGR